MAFMVINFSRAPNILFILMTKSMHMKKYSFFLFVKRISDILSKKQKINIS